MEGATEGVTLWHWLLRRVVANIFIIPAFIANYLFLWLAGNERVASVEGLSVVFMGDLIALAINNLLLERYTEWGARVRKRFGDEWFTQPHPKREHDD